MGAHKSRHAVAEEMSLRTGRSEEELLARSFASGSFPVCWSPRGSGRSLSLPCIRWRAGHEGQGAHRASARHARSLFRGTGARIALADLNQPDATAAGAAKAGAAQTLALACDVSNESAVLAVGAELKKTFGGIDVLVHCAGVIHEAPLLETPVTDFDRVIASTCAAASSSAKWPSS
ncbi:hypothetical protein FQR65_LT18044 [Abscondita terminalis]|nr:hypothetical protein FQR65_LT18044 [Abscondita terminalis]